MSDINREIEQIKRTFEVKDNQIASLTKLCEELVEIYLRPDAESKIKERPYRIKTIIGYSYNNFESYDDRCGEKRVNKPHYQLQKQKLEFSLYTLLESKETIPTYWVDVALFETKEQAEEAMAALIKDFNDEVK